MNLIQRLFGSMKPALNKPDVSGSCNPYDAHEKLLVERIIEMLETKPECFSARWLTKVI